MDGVEVLPAVFGAHGLGGEHSGGEEDGGARVDPDLHGLSAVGYGSVLALLLHALRCAAQAPCPVHRKVSIHHEGIRRLLPMLLRVKQIGSQFQKLAPMACTCRQACCCIQVCDCRTGSEAS